MATYYIAEVLNTGEFGVIEEFEAIDDDDATNFAEKNYGHIEWYILDRDGNNIYD
jgi:hypothetical protein